MSAISLLHAIGVLLILLPRSHLADHNNSSTTIMKMTTESAVFLPSIAVGRDLNQNNQNQTMARIFPVTISESLSDVARVTVTATTTAEMGKRTVTTTGFPRTSTLVTMTSLSLSLSPSRQPPLVKWTNLPDRSFPVEESGRDRRSRGVGADLILSDDPSEPLQLSSSTRIIGPYFESNRTSTIVSSRAGQDVMLDCAVVLLQGRTVSWLRRRSENLQLLTVGNQTYSSDSRLSLHFRYPNNWRLGILKVNKRDEGEYQCQLSTHPPKALVFHLRVIAPAVQILDDNEHVITERHYKVDSSLHLTCRASHLDKLVDHVTWFKGDRLLPGTDTRVKVKQWKNQTNGEASAFLSVLSVRKGDSGNYSCRASLLAQNTVVVHVLNEKLPAAVQHGNSANVLSVCHSASVFCLLTAKGLLRLVLPAALLLQFHVTIDFSS